MPRRFGSFRSRKSLGQVDRSHRPKKEAIFALQRHRFIATGAFFIGMHGSLGRPLGIPPVTAALKAISPSAKPLNVRCASADEIEEVVVPNIHPDDAPEPGKGLDAAGNLGHQPVSAMSFGIRRRSARKRCHRTTGEMFVFPRIQKSPLARASGRFTS